MVRVINFHQRVAEDGSQFYALELQGGVEFVKSERSGRYYATAKSCSITSTFDQSTCESLVGQELPGRIAKVDCDPYDYAIKDTGEVITLDYRYMYIPEDSGTSVITSSGDIVAPTPSLNGVLEEAFA